MKWFRLGTWFYLGAVLGLPLVTLAINFPWTKISPFLFLSKAFRNSLLIAAGTTLFAGLLGTTSAFFLTKIRIRYTQIS